MDFEAAGINRRGGRNAFFTLVALCVLFAAGGVLVLGGDALQPTPRLQLSDMRHAQVVEIRNDGGQTVLSGEFRARTGAMGNIEKDAALRDRSGRDVIGEVEIDIPRPGATDLRQELEIDIISLPPSTEFTVFIDDRPATTFTTDDRGSVDIEIASAPPESAPR